MYDALKRLILSVFIFLFSGEALYSQYFNFHKNIHGYETGMTISLGIYQSYANSYIHLRRSGSTPIFNPKDERSIYRWLGGRLLNPKYLILQVTGYPLATVSSYLETFHPAEFNRLEYMNINLLRTVGSGPEEPYAISLLLGNFVFLGYIDSADSNLRQSGSALAGFLITTGHWHHYDNIRINDRWWQIELILTGILKEPNVRKVQWNFRIGTKFHHNKLVPDVAVLSIRRDNTNWLFKRFSVLKNSVIRYEAHFPIGKERQRSPFTIRQLFSYGKKFPMKIFNHPIAFRFGGGILWEWVRGYDHDRRVFESDETVQLIWLIQPSVEF